MYNADYIIITICNYFIKHSLKKLLAKNGCKVHVGLNNTIIHRYGQGHGNSQSCRTLSDKSSECPVIYKVHGEQDKSGKNRSKCSAVGSMFPHPWV